MFRFAQNAKRLNTSNDESKKSEARSGEGYPPANRKEPHRNQNRKCNMIAKDCVDKRSRIEMKPNDGCYLTNRVPRKQPQSCASKSANRQDIWSHCSKYFIICSSPTTHATYSALSDRRLRIASTALNLLRRADSGRRCVFR
jgi:hypothetical protein